MKTMLITAMSLAATLAAPASAIVVGGSGSYGDCAPTSCAARYQQAYSASLFSGPIAISRITFYDGSGANQSIRETGFTYRLSTSANAVGSLSSTFADNIGTDVKTFFSGTLGGATGPSFFVKGATFNYDPSAGDLLLDVSVTSNVNSFRAFIDYRSDFAGFQRVFSFDQSSSGQVNFDYGLVTGFNAGGARNAVIGGAVPEPASWALMIGGFGLVGAAMRRRTLVAA